MALKHTPGNYINLAWVFSWASEKTIVLKCLQFRRCRRKIWRDSVKVLFLMPKSDHVTLPLKDLQLLLSYAPWTLTSTSFPVAPSSLCPPAPPQPPPLVPLRATWAPGPGDSCHKWMTWSLFFYFIQSYITQKAQTEGQLLPDVSLHCPFPASLPLSPAVPPQT